MEVVNVVCPSCFKNEMELDFSGDASVCHNCSYVMQNKSFFQKLTGDSTLIVDGSFTAYRLWKNVSLQDLTSVARIMAVYEGVYLIDGCNDLDKALPFAKKIQELWPDLKLNVVDGISTSLEKCPLCGVRNYGYKDDVVYCQNCEKLKVSPLTFVYSQIVGSFRSTYFVEDGFLKLFRTTLVHPKWWQPFAKSETFTTPVATLQLRPKVVNCEVVGYVLAVQVADEVGGLLEKSKIVNQIKASFRLNDVTVMDGLKVI